MTDQFDVGGIEHLVVTFANDAASRGIAVSVLAASRGSSWDDLAEGVEQIPIAGLDSGGVRKLIALSKLARFLLFSKYDVVHAHQRSVALIANVVNAIKPSNGLTIEHVHNSFIPVSYRAVSFKGKRIIACSQNIKSQITKFYRRPDKNVSVIPNGVPTTSFAPIRDADSGLRILAVGRLSTQKDPERFVRTVAALAALGTKIEQAVWVGDGELRAQTQRLIESLGLSELISLVGSGNPHGWYKWAHILLVTSAWEGLPLVLLESMAAGRAAVAPDVGGISEVVDSSNGRLYEPKADPKEIAMILQELSRDDGRLGEMGERAFKTIESAWSEERMLGRLADYYRSVNAS